MKKLLIICGPTATGKTELALRLSRLLGGVLISADSRQVYRGMDIGTGKDADRVGRILGYDLVHPKEKFSVAQYLTFAKKAIRTAWSKRKLPILVGGTGLYIKSVLDGIETAGVAQNKTLREHLGKKSVEELYDILASDDPLKAANMNLSDKKNPRRLIRAIEIAVSGKVKKTGLTKPIEADALTVGLTAPKNILESRIAQRVEKRIDQGIEREIEALLKKGVSWEDQSMYSLGYRQFKEHFEGEKSIDEVVREWTREEQKYAKRQLTWFKKGSRVNWFDVTDKDFSKKVENLAQNWYIKDHAKEN